MIWGVRKALSELNNFVPLLMLVLRRCRLVTYMVFGPWSKRAKRDPERLNELNEFLLSFPVLKIRMFPLGWLANLEWNRKVFHMAFCIPTLPNSLEPPLALSVLTDIIVTPSSSFLGHFNSLLIDGDFSSLVWGNSDASFFLSASLLKLFFPVLAGHLILTLFRDTALCNYCCMVSEILGYKKTLGDLEIIL